MAATVRTYSIVGVEAREVRVEADVRTGLPAFALVGLPDAAVRESRERVRAALSNSGFDYPQKRITANLAPADLRKAGPGFDLAIAAAVLADSGQLEAPVLDGLALAGELALDGEIRPVPGILPMAEAAARAEARAFVVPRAVAPEAALVGGLRVIPVDHLKQLVALGTDAEPAQPEPLALGLDETERMRQPDLSELRGQPALARALELAAAGAHSLKMVGPPGAGKSMAARRLPSLLPPLDPFEMVEAMRVASACGRPLDAPTVETQPERGAVSPSPLIVRRARPPRRRPGQGSHRTAGILVRLHERRGGRSCGSACESAGLACQLR